jgi:hypothetical protein
MIILTLIVSAAIFAGVYSAFIGGSHKTRVAVVSVALIVTTTGGYYVGSSWQNIKNQEMYVWPFSRYSTALRVLAERGELATLTNNIIIFDSKFNAHQEPKDLEDAVETVLRTMPSQ